MSNDELNTALFKAVYKSDTQEIENLLAQGADINAKHQGLKQKTVLLESVISSNDETLIKLLIENGADKGCVDNNGDSALHYATLSIFPSIEQVRFLLDVGCNPNQENNSGETSFFNICRHSSGDSTGRYKKILDLLVKNGVDIYKRDKKSGRLYLDFLDDDSVFDEMMSFLDANTASEAIKCRHERKAKSSVFEAIEKGFYKKAKKILDSMNNPVFKVDDISPIVFASKTPSRHQKKCIEMLLNKGYDINQIAEDQTTTALTEAVKSNNFELFKWLIERNADPYTPLRAGQTPIKMAEQLERFDMVSFVKAMEDQAALDRLIDGQENSAGLTF